MRRTVDTNVLVRALVHDGSDQSNLAIECLTTGRIHIPTSVLLEAEWIFRSAMSVSRREVTKLFRVLLGQENMEFDDFDLVASAVKAHEAGIDFADALHLYASAGSESFVTFDKTLRRRSRRLVDIVTVMEPT
jgi:predicted nucleic-acid-binding protein